MTIPREDAASILSKWATEANPVSALLIAGGMAVSFSGFIVDFLPDALVVAQRDTSGNVTTSATINLSAVMEFEYKDSREAPEEIREYIQREVISSLVLKLDKAECCIYELVV